MIAMHQPIIAMRQPNRPIRGLRRSYMNLTA